jgi:hypothetical protein
VTAADVEANTGPAQDATPPSVSLKATVGGPGSEIRVPIYLDSGDNTLASLSFRVSFSNPPLSFVKLEVASRRLEPIARNSKASIVVGEAGLVEIELSNEKAPFPDGPLGWLIFRVSDPAEAKEVPLGLLRPSARASSGENIENVKTEGASVVLVVEEEMKTLTSCFFYMH